MGFRSGGATLLSTKLYAPALTANVVARPRLLRLLEDGLERKLVLVSAPAGTGKSTLLAAGLKRLRRRSAWLSLGLGDNELGRFLLYFIGALQQLEPAFGRELRESLQHQSPVNAEPLLISLTNELVQLDAPITLVLDDYHVLSDEKIHGAVDFLLEHLPPHLRLVIATRTDPPLALAKLRAQGELLELRGHDLRFNLQETTHFLNDRLGLDLSPKATATLEAQTEGWIAALQLAALSLAGQRDKEAFVEAFAGSHRFLVDYLVDEVLNQHPPWVQRFLQRTSILERFTAPLCEAVTGESVATDLLGQLEAANLFLIPLDGERKWYRYHHLFAEFLLHRLRENEPGLVPDLHLRASRWLEHEGWSDEAIEHALLGHDLERTGRLVENIAFGLQNTFNNAQLVKYVSRFPLELLADLPRLGIYYGWALVNTGQVAQLRDILPVLERSADHASQAQLVRACVLALEAYQHLWRMDFASTVRLCQEALAMFDESAADDASDEARWLRSAATNVIAYSYFYSDLARADSVYPAAMELSQRLGNHIGTANDFARLGWVKHLLGRSREARSVFKRGFETLRRWGETAVNGGELHLNWARLLYEWNRLDEAERHLAEARRLNEPSRFIPVMALEMKVSFSLHLARGEGEAAHTLLGRLDGLTDEVHPDNLFYRQLLEVMAMELRMSLVGLMPGLEYLFGEVDAWIRSRKLAPHDNFRYFDEGRYYLLARALTAQGRAAEAVALLLRLSEAAEAEGRIDDLVRALTLRALAQQSSAQQDLALDTLQRALSVAEPEGYCRSFVDHGLPMRTLLGQLARRENKPYIMRLLRAFPDGASLNEHQGEVAPLNKREQSVLRLLAVGNSHKQIAKALGLSPNTVRWYMQSLYSKLQVNNRTEAVNRGRDEGLL